jgi:hypothetical protein
MFKILGIDGKEYGPVSGETLQQWVQEGRANAQTQVRRESDPTWTTLGNLPELAPFLHQPGRPAVVNSAPQNNPFALIGFILSLLSITVALCCCYGVPFNLIGITLSSIGLAQIRRSPGQYSGRGLALAGIILGCVSLVLGIVLLILGVAFNWADISRDLQKI